MSQTVAAKPVAPKAPAADPTKPSTLKVANPNEVPFRIQPLRTHHRYIKILAYGPAGSGKTTLVGSSIDVEGMEDVLFVNCEAGGLSIEDSPIIVNKDLIDQVRVTEFKPVAHIQEFLKAHCTLRDRNDVEALKKLQARFWGYSADIIEDDQTIDDEWYEDENGAITYTRARLRRYRTCILDSISEINSYLIYHLLGITVDSKFDSEDAQETAGWDEYKKNNQMFQMLIRAYRDLNMNILCVCGARYTQDELKVFHWAPNLTGKLADQILGYFDVVGYMVVGKPKEDKPTEIPRSLYIQPLGRYAAKTRLASFKMPFINNPTMQTIMDIFRGIKRKQPPVAAPKEAKKDA